MTKTTQPKDGVIATSENKSNALIVLDSLTGITGEAAVHVVENSDALKDFTATISETLAMLKPGINFDAPRVEDDVEAPSNPNAIEVSGLPDTYMRFGDVACKNDGAEGVQDDTVMLDPITGEAAPYCDHHKQSPKSLTEADLENGNELMGAFPTPREIQMLISQLGGFKSVFTAVGLTYPKQADGLHNRLLYIQKVFEQLYHSKWTEIREELSIAIAGHLEEIAQLLDGVDVRMEELFAADRDEDSIIKELNAIDADLLHCEKHSSSIAALLKLTGTNDTSQRLRKAVPEMPEKQGAEAKPKTDEQLTVVTLNDWYRFVATYMDFLGTLSNLDAALRHVNSDCVYSQPQLKALRSYLDSITITHYQSLNRRLSQLTPEDMVVLTADNSYTLPQLTGIIDTAKEQVCLTTNHLLKGDLSKLLPLTDSCTSLARANAPLIDAMKDWLSIVEG